MFCPNCGYPLLDDTVKCEYCGFVIKSKDNKKQTGSEQGSMMNKNVGVGGSAAEGMGTGDNRNRADRRRAANHGGFSAGTSNGKRGGNGGQNIVLKILIGLVNDGILTLAEAAKRADMTVEEFQMQTGLMA